MYSHPPVSRRDRVAGLLTSVIAEARLRASIGSSVELLVHRTVDEHVANVRRGPVAVSVVEICAETGGIVAKGTMPRGRFLHAAGHAEVALHNSNAADK